MIILIPARGGSKRIPRKNLQVVGGKTLLARAVEKADELGKSLWDGTPCHVVVSTDSNEIASAAMDVFAPVHMRSEFASSDEALMSNVVAELSFNPDEVVAVLQPCNPFISINDMRRCVHLNKYTTRPTVIYDIAGFRSGFYVATAAYWTSTVADAAELSDAMMITRYPMRRLKTPQELWGCAIAVPVKGTVDINTPEDLELARKLWDETHGK